MSLAYTAANDGVTGERNFLVMNQPRGYQPWLKNFCLIIFPVSIICIVFYFSWNLDAQLCQMIGKLRKDYLWVDNTVNALEKYTPDTVTICCYQLFIFLSCTCRCFFYLLTCCCCFEPCGCCRGCRSDHHRSEKI